MMKKILLLIIAIIVYCNTNAQSLQDVIYLKNGSIIRGTLIEQVPKTKIKTFDGSIWVFDTEEVDRITSEPKINNRLAPSSIDYARERIDSQHKTRKSRNTLPPLSHGLRMILDFGYQEGVNHYSCSAIGISVSLGYQFANHFYLGAGISDQAYIDYYYYGVYSDEPEIYAQMPMFATFRYDFKKERVSPVLEFRAGYAVSADYQNDYQGLYLNPQVGIRIGRATISMGADMVKLKEPWVYEEYLKNGQIKETTTKIQASFAFKLGIEWGGRN